MYDRGDYVFLVDLPRPFLCRVLDAETFTVGSSRSQMLKLAPLDGPWPADTTLIRLDHCVKPCDVRSRWRAPFSRAGRRDTAHRPAHRNVRRAAA